MLPVKTPDPAHETSRAVSKTEASTRGGEPGPRRSDEHEDADFEPKYLSLPQRRSRGQGRRNLTWGVTLLLLSGLLFAWALYLAGPGAAYTVGGSIATGVALYVVARSRLLRQRNGSFLAGAIVCLLGVFLVLVQQAWLAAIHSATAVPVEPAERVAASTPVPPTKSLAGSASAQIPSLLDAVRPSQAELDSGAVAKVLHDSRIELEGKPYRLRTGDVFPVAGSSPGEVRLAVGAQEVAVPSSAVEVTEPKGFVSSRRPSEAGDPLGEPKRGAAETNAQTTQKAQAEAMRRYPALAIKDSPENKSFMDAYQELKYAGGASFFEDPEWPLHLADMLASREGWNGVVKKGPVADDEPAPAAPGRPMRQPVERSEEMGRKGTEKEQ